MIPLVLAVWLLVSVLVAAIFVRTTRDRIRMERARVEVSRDLDRQEAQRKADLDALMEERWIESLARKLTLEGKRILDDEKHAGRVYLRPLERRRS